MIALNNRAQDTRFGICEALEPRRLLTAVSSHGFDPNVLPHEFTYTFDTPVGASLDDEDIAVENLTANERIFGLS